MDIIRVNESAISAVEDYLEYRRIVGEDDGGRLFTPEQYEAYKQQVLPARLQNRLYVSWGVPGGMDCKLIGPETRCFCSHRYKQHQTDLEKLPVERPLALPCRVPGCGCVSYSYIHLNGSQPVRCRCKHSVQDHSEAGGRRCRKCSTCTAFHSPYTCSCGQPSYAHKTLVETKEERLARGMPVGKDVPYIAMGGLTGFSSLAEGFLRLDNRGLGGQIGHPLYSGLELAGSRASVDCALEEADGACSQTADINSLKQKKSDLKTREEEDMAVFERRYKERRASSQMASLPGLGIPLRQRERLSKDS
ncbi:protein FAM221A isoform X2 [Brienomyrus brachyistius]|uniref:protein FAM221A isoform X2 n=1 Tax=Brienomyrus brachyistius TaxID=42636 RepID=UPI0020B37F46|nr:protein FAM221A isoform X2 [Brienomyrus brachyistius]